MDSFMGLAQKGLEAYNKSHSDVSKTGGQEFNSPQHSQAFAGYGPDLDHDEVVRKAGKEGSGDSSLFATALSFLSDNKSKQKDEPVDEDEAQRAHKKVYEEGDTRGLSASSLGSAAALQILKKFTSGEDKKSSGSSTDLISMAMAEATKLFDKSDASASGNKQDAVNGAAMTIMKLFVQSKTSGTVGGGSSGGLGSLLSMASKFAK